MSVTTTYFSRPGSVVLSNPEAPSDEWVYEIIAPADYGCGDQDYGTSVTVEHDITSNYAFGQVTLLERDLDNYVIPGAAVLKNGTDFVPPELFGNISAQRLHVVYSCSHPADFNLDAGDSGFITASGPAGEMQTAVGSVTYALSFGNLFAAPSDLVRPDDDAVTVAITIHEWWLETDTTIDPQPTYIGDGLTGELGDTGARFE